MPNGSNNNRSIEPDQYGSLSTRFSGQLADVDLIPASVRAVLGYHAASGQFALDVIRVKKYAEQFIQDTIRDAFTDIEIAIANEFDIPTDDVKFDYETKLTMPAELTLGHIYRQAINNSLNNFNPITRKTSTPLGDYFRFPFDKDAETKRRQKFIERSSEQLDKIELTEEVTELVVVALLDGDMRDAINDQEFQDFEMSPVGELDDEQAASVAQDTLQKKVEELFEPFNNNVRTAYEEAVELSEGHQEDDPYFRELMATAKQGDEEALADIRENYKYGSFDQIDFEGSLIEPQTLFDEDQEFPYLKTQYGRVGVIYDGMIEMYRYAGIDIEDLFKRSIIFAIIGAQIWLDDIDDYHADLAETQLTPVTAEYLLSGTDQEAYENIERIAKQYLMTAKRYAAETNSPLAGIGTDYIYRLGTPDVLHES